jgi:ComF family protein
MFLKDFLFPKVCLGCGFLGAYICLSCQKQLRYLNGDTCFYCQRSSFFGLTHPVCRKNLNIDGLTAIFYYNPLLKKIIKNIKYRLATDVWREFCQIIKPEQIDKLGFYKELSHQLVFQPIPLSQKKFNERGFNQAKIISEYFQKFLNFPLANLLIRKKETPPQAQLESLEKRYQNVRGAFEVTDKNLINNKSILLVDDVVTTGSTVKEAARILKKAGAKRVYILALARG